MAADFINILGSCDKMILEFSDYSNRIGPFQIQVHKNSTLYFTEFLSTLN